MPETIKDILADVRDRLLAISNLAPGESATFTIRIEGPLQATPAEEVNALGHMTIAQFFTRERMERAAEVLQMSPQKHRGVITLAMNAIWNDTSPNDQPMSDWLKHRPTTTRLLGVPYLGRVSCRIILQAVTSAGFTMTDTANVMKKK